MFLLDLGSIPVKVKFIYVSVFYHEVNTLSIMTCDPSLNITHLQYVVLDKSSIFKRFIRGSLDNGSILIFVFLTTGRKNQVFNLR